MTFLHIEWLHGFFNDILNFFFFTYIIIWYGKLNCLTLIYLKKKLTLEDRKLVIHWEISLCNGRVIYQPKILPLSHYRPFFIFLLWFLFCFLVFLGGESGVGRGLFFLKFWNIIFKIEKLMPKSTYFSRLGIPVFSLV